METIEIVYSQLLDALIDRKIISRTWSEQIYTIQALCDQGKETAWPSSNNNEDELFDTKTGKDMI